MLEKLNLIDANQIRLIVFIFLLTLLAISEFVFPWRERSISRASRWFQNLSLTVINSFVAKFTLGSVPITISYMCLEKEIGLLNIYEMPNWVTILFTYILLDLIIYLQHLMFHATPLLWRLHKVHHSDLDLDVTSGFRFHPIEIIISLVIKAAGILTIGAHPIGVLLFEVLLNAGSLFNHSNIKVPDSIDKYLRLVIVTPKVHLVHHSTIQHETNSNFGFTISIWDRVFGTYRSKSTFENFKIGLDDYQSVEKLGIVRLAALPFENIAQEYSMDSKKTK